MASTPLGTESADKAAAIRRPRPSRVSSARRRTDRLVGTSRSIQRAVEQVAVASRGRFPVWIQGEEGIERELIARLIHNQSEWVTNGFFALDGEPALHVFQVLPVTAREMEVKLDRGLEGFVEQLEEIDPDIYGPCNVRRPTL